MPPVNTLRSKLPSGGVSIFAVMTRLANEVGAINLSQGFPDFETSPELIDTVARYMREGYNQYAPMPGVLALREALSTKIEADRSPPWNHGSCSLIQSERAARGAGSSM